MPRLPFQLTYNDLNGAEAVDILTDWFRRLLQSQPLMQPHLTLPMAKITLDIGVQIDMYVGGTVPVASPPERLDIAGSVTLDNSVGGGGTVRLMRQDPVVLSTVVNAAPIPGGQTPDQVREAHDLPIPRPGVGPRDIGAHVQIADIIEATERRARADMPAPRREGIVAKGYVFASEPSAVADSRQTIPVDKGAIKIDQSGDGIDHANIHVSAGTHVSSKKTLGDQGGSAYGSVAGVYDAGPAGLARPGAGGGLYADGRPRISFGNSHRGG